MNVVRLFSCALSFAAMGCTAEVTPSEDLAALDARALSSGCAPSVPEAIRVPAGNKLAFDADAEGVQIYSCQLAADGSGAAAWTLKAPDATLYGKRHRVLGTHYAGPTWEALDGSTVVGARVAGVTPDASAIPWLLLSAASNSGDGLMSKVTFIQRSNTSGGLAPQSGCDANRLGTEIEIAYTATYNFYRASGRRH
ncbi:MAG TPA: DUF3455 domain-containing protein [Polyangiales bacterium]|nr:DUF3455 domain-containing protein [Polyangiales bacterium]